MPPEAVIVFDGVCNLCSWWVRFVIRRDPEATFRFAPAQSAAGIALLKRYGLDPESVQTFLLVAGGGAYVRSDAALEIARRMRGPWKLLAVGVLIPKPVRDWLYDLVSRNRYAWFGRRERCVVPTEDIRGRFVAEASHPGPAEGREESEGK